MQKAVLIDRDGVINENCPQLDSIEKYRMYPFVPKAIKRFNDAGYLVIIVTNQPDIAKGFYSFAKLEEIHEHMKKLLAKEKAHVDGIYVCPHHPKKGFEGEIPELKIDCECRKPKPGLLLQAIEDFDIDNAKSFMIGDSKGDILAGKAAGVKTIFVTEGGGSGSEQEKDLELDADYATENLESAVEIILGSLRK